jgi:hypothetical protein
VFLVVVFILVFDLVVFAASPRKRETHEATATPTADRSSKEELAELPLVIIVFVLFLDVIVFTRFARKSGQADHAAAFAASQSSCKGELSCTTHLFQTFNVLVLVGHCLPFPHLDVGHMSENRPAVSARILPPIESRDFRRTGMFEH